MKKLFLILGLLNLCSCANRETAIVVDKPVIPVYVPSEVRSTNISISVTKDSENNTLYSFDENNFIKLKKFLLDITRNNEFTREVVCYYNGDICLSSEKSAKEK